MELRRVARLLRNRWWVVLIVSLIGLVAAFGFSLLANESIDPVFEARIPVRFIPAEGESIEDLADEIQDQRGLAVLAAEELLLEHPNSSISSDTTSARLVFAAQGASPDEARATTNQLVSVYLEADPASGGNISQQLAEYEQQATELEDEIAAIQPTLSSEEQNLAAQHELLGLQIRAVQDRIVALTVATAGASAPESAAYAAEAEDLRASLSELQAERDALPPRPATELTAADRLRVDAIERRLEILRSDYERLALRTMGVTTAGTVEPATVSDLTPDPVNPVTNGMVGFFGGGAVALFALVFQARVRREIWLGDDLPLPVLGVVPVRRVSSMPGPSWYDSTEGGSRKESIQTVRAAIEGVLEHAPTALAVLGEGLDAESYHALAVDMAASFASAGRTVLLVDADYSGTADMPEYKVGEPTLESVLRLPTKDTQPMQEGLSRILEDAVHVRTDLAVMPGGDTPVSPADAVAGRQFRAFINEAMSRFDLVIVVVGSARSATAQVIVQRVGSVLLAVTPGKTTVPAVTSLITDLDHQHVRTVGAVMIYGSESRTSASSLRNLRWTRNGRHEADDYGPGASSAVNRLLAYPFPGGKEVSPVQAASLQRLTTELTQSEAEQHEATLLVAQDRSTESDPGSSVLEALRSSDRIAAREPVAEYVVSRVEDMLTAVAGQASLSDEFVDVILERGFIPLTPTKGHRSVGDWLVEEFRSELGRDRGEELAREFARVLGGFGDDFTEALNMWLSDQFFDRHLQRTKNEPEVWHLTSNRGTAQILVHARRLTKRSLDRLTADVTRRLIDEHQRALSKANEAGNVSEIESLSRTLRELHQFEVALVALHGGTTEEARLRYPWKRHQNQPRGWEPVWTEGVRPNIAPVQRLGLLAAPVVTEEELISFGLTG